MRQHFSTAGSSATSTKHALAEPTSFLRPFKLITFALLLAILLASCGGSDTPSAESEEAPAAADTATAEPQPDPTATTAPDPTSTTAPDPTATPEPEPEPGPTDTPQPEAEPPATVQAQEESASDSEGSPAVGQTFTIVAEESEARFIIEEELLGQPKTVIGATNAIAGELTVDSSNPAASVIGPIQIDAGTFVTDDNRRNGAIRRFILQTNQYQFITFNTTELNGLPDTVAVGDEVVFEVSGDLTVRDITNPALFVIILQVVSESELRGSAATIVAREDFNLTIPQVPSVANVGTELIVEFEFVARSQ